MIMHPNETLVQAAVKRIVACADGHGHEVDLEILGNESPDPKADFLRPKVGDQLRVFSADLGPLEAGWQIHAALGLSGGPFAQRAVLRRAERVPVKP
jgi:hypothetical protein